jgi:hypothetical protein
MYSIFSFANLFAASLLIAAVLCGRKILALAIAPLISVVVLFNIVFLEHLILGSISIYITNVILILISITCLMILSAIVPSATSFDGIFSAAKGVNAKEIALAVAFLLILLIGFGIAIEDPNIGYDIEIRWTRISNLLFSEKGFVSYPPFDDFDYLNYFYSDGFPAGLPVVFWFFSGGGETVSTIGLSLSIVMLSAALVGSLSLYLRARGVARPMALAFIVVLASSKTVIQVFSKSEVILIAAGIVGFLALLELLPVDRRTSVRIPLKEGYQPFSAQGGLFVVLGFLAALPALVRESGIWVPIVATFVVVYRIGPRRELLLYLVTAVLLSTPWYFRNWALFGNPIWPLDFFGVFETNEGWRRLMDDISRRNALWHVPISEIAKIPIRFIWDAPLALIGLILVAKDFRRNTTLLFFAAVAVFFWALSTRYFSIGLSHSMKNLVPVMVLLSCVAVLSLKDLSGVGSRGSGQIRVIVVWIAGFLLIVKTALDLIAGQNFVSKSISDPKDMLQRVGATARYSFDWARGRSDLVVEGACESVTPDTITFTDSMELWLARRECDQATLPVWAPGLERVCQVDESQRNRHMAVLLSNHQAVAVKFEVSDLETYLGGECASWVSRNIDQRGTILTGSNR